MNMSIHAHTCAHIHVCSHAHIFTYFVNSSNITTSIDAIIDGEFQEFHPGNPSWPIIAGNLLSQIHRTENMSNELGNHPRLQHAEKRKLSSGLAGFGRPGRAWNTCVASDSISRCCREGSVIGKRGPSRRPAWFNHQCPLKKLKIHQQRNAVSRVTISVSEPAGIDLRFQPCSLTAHLTMQLGS